MSEKSFKVSLRLIEKYLFEVDFGEFGDVMTDEPEPLGDGEGPNPARLLAASVGNCLAASLLFALRKYGDQPAPLNASIEGALARIDGRWRIELLTVQINMGNKASELEHIEKALSQFEDFCIVTQSVRQGINVNVEVFDETGLLLTKR